MVDHDACIVAGRRCIGTIVDILLLTTTGTNIAHDDVVAIGINGVIAKGNAWRWSRLTKDGCIGANVDIAL